MTTDKNENSAKIKQIMQDNPDLSYEFVHQLLIAQAEVKTILKASGDNYKREREQHGHNHSDNH